MPHGIGKTGDGRDAKVYVGRTPWHRLGTPLDPSQARDLDAVLDLSGLDFEVARLPHRALGPAGPGDPSADDVVHQGVRYRVVESKDSFGVVRLDTMQELGSVSGSWHPLQNRDSFEPLRAALDSGLASIETGGVLDDGRQVWMLVRFDREHVLGMVREQIGSPRDPAYTRIVDTLEGEAGGGIVPFALLYNSHSGSRHAMVKPTPVRVVCANTLEVCLRSRRTTAIEIRHGPAVRRDYARAVAGLFRDLVSHCQELADQRDLLKRTRLAEGDFRRLVLDVAVPLSKWEQAGKPLNPSAGKLLREMRLEADELRRAEIRRLWDRGAGHQGDRTAWEAYNALVQWADHSPSASSVAGGRRYRGSRPERRVEDLIHGGLAELKREVALALTDHARGTASSARPGRRAASTSEAPASGSRPPRAREAANEVRFRARQGEGSREPEWGFVRALRGVASPVGGEGA